MSFGCLAVWLFSIENLYAHCFVEHRENGLILLHTTRHKRNMSMQKYEAKIRICCADYRECASFELIRSKSAIRCAYTKIGE